ncbi:MAG: type I glutamate--ammonia ligase [Planctomycetes bacterium]|nr:type I glutamate--ammonia ligase [Planctomycetota bacterium]
MAKTAKDVLELAKQKGANTVDFRFMDFIGTWQHFSVPIRELTEEVFKEGLGFDGSSIRGWQGIHESDMLVIPDASTAFIDPFFKDTTLVLICTIQDPITRADYNKDPRNIAQKAEKYLASTGIGDQVFVGPEAEFFVFDNIRIYGQTNAAGYEIESEEGHWTSGRPGSETRPNLGHDIRPKEGYFPVPPIDQQQDLRNEMMLTMEQIGLKIERQHHEVATAGQAEIDFVFDTLTVTADNLMKYKYVVKNVAQKYGKCATFMPKPLFGDNGSGMHTHMSIWKGGKNTFAGNGYAGLSESALFAMGGILKHARALTAITNPTTNSYKRLTPGYEAPINLAYSARNRSACLRIPMFSQNPKAKRFEFRCPDPTCNPYLAFSALLMAAIDGIQNKIDPGKPLDKDIYDLPPEELAKVPNTPGSLDEALNALEEDHEFLLKGEVFTSDVVETWIDYKRKKEADQVRLRPHPHEFYLYFDM